MAEILEDNQAQLERDLATLRQGGVPSEAELERRRRRRNRRLRRWGIALAVVLALGGFALFRYLTRPVEVVLVAVSTREVGLPKVELTAAGYIIAERQIMVSSKAQGRIIEMPVDENDFVKQGELIAKLEDDEQRAALALASAEYEKVRRDFERITDLVARGIASQADLDAARATFQVAAARRELQQVALENTIVRAPIEGVVIRKIRDEGEFLTIGVSATGDPGTVVATLADLSSLYVELEISESEISKVSLGQAAIVTPEAFPDQRYVADVTEIAAMADRQKAVVKVKVRLREPDRESLKPDMTARVAFLESAPTAEIELKPALPGSSVVERAGRTVVFTVDDGRAIATPVKVEPIGEDYVAIIDGIREGRQVVAAPPEALESGDRVEVGG